MTLSPPPPPHLAKQDVEEIPELHPSTGKGKKMQGPTSVDRMMKTYINHVLQQPPAQPPAPPPQMRRPSMGSIFAQSCRR